MRYLSLFTGIGGFEVGIERAYEIYAQTTTDKIRWYAPECIGFSEIDKYATSIYERHFPKHRNFGDITKINEKELPDFDLLVGGFPCQTFSVAGKRAGFADTRGTLFFDIARILKEKQPRLFLLENVKGLLSHDEGRTVKVIFATLDELGYDIQWQVLNSKDFGVPQNRERIFIVGHLRGTPRPKVFPINGADSKDIVQVNNPKHSNDRIYSPEGVSPTLNTIQGGNRQPKIYDDYNSKWRKDDITCTLTPNTGSKSERNGQKVFDGVTVRRLTPIECERLQGFQESEKSCIIEVCLDPQKSYVSVVNQSLKSQRLVGNVERNNSKENVLSVEKNSDSNNPQINKLAQPDVLIDCVENGVEIHSQGRLLLNAKNAEKKNWFHPHIKIDDFVQLLVGLNTMLEKEIRLGKGESHQNEDSLTPLKNGLVQENLSGSEITLPVGDAESDSTTLKELLKFTTLDHSSTESSEQRLKTLSLFVTRAITGFIPKEILNQTIFTIEVKTRVGHTFGVSDTQRYKCCGNAVTTNVIQAVMERLLT